MEPIQVRPKQHSPRWQGPDAKGALPAAEPLRSWLLETGSLTARIRHSGDRFALELLGEGVEPANPDDLRLLGSSDRSLHVRRVRLSGHGTQLVFACTLVPLQTLARHRWLANLGDQPLGDALASQAEISRTDFEFACIDELDPLYADALQGTDIAPDKLWARRSLFTVQGDPILVYEVFLPGVAHPGNT
ncbi:MAG: chorismate lyase [Gammaproteobacteria bacterium]